MKTFARAYLVRIVLAASLALGSTAGAWAADPLFVNLTSDEAHRSHMALSFAQEALKRGHPVTVFLNVDSVRLAAKEGAAFAHHRDMLAELVAAGGKVYVCPHCLEHAGMKPADLMPGADMGNPEKVQGALFAPGARSMSW